MIEAVKNSFFRHWPGFACALVIGLLLAAPNLWLFFDRVNGYAGMPLSGIDNDHFYLNRIAAVARGNLSATQSTLSGLPASPYTNPAGAELIIASLGKLLHLDLGSLVVFSNFLFPFLLSLVFYAFAYQFSRSRLAATAATLAVMLASNLVFNLANLRALFFDHSQLWHNVYNRPIHPQVSSPLFFTWLCLLYLWQKKQSKTHLVFSGLLFGLMFYVYPYAWMLAGAILGWLLIFFLVRKNWMAVKGLLAILVLGLGVSFGYWVNQWQLIHHPFYTVILQRFVLLPTRALIWSNLVFATAGLAAIYYWRSRKVLESIFLLAVVAGLWTVLNQQIITGVQLFPGHWHWYYVVPVFIIVGVLATSAVLKNWRIPRSLLLATLCLIVLADGYFTQTAYFQKEIHSVKAYQRYLPVYDWLVKNTRAGSTVLADPSLSTFLPAFSGDFRYLYLATDELYLVPTERLLNAFFVQLYLEGVTEEKLDQYLNSSTPQFMELLNGYYRRYAEGCYACYTEAEIGGVRDRYREFLKNNFYESLKKYPIDYAVYDPDSAFKVDFNSLQGFEYLASVESFKIYKVR